DRDKITPTTYRPEWSSPETRTPGQAADAGQKLHAIGVPLASILSETMRCTPEPVTTALARRRDDPVDRDAAGPSVIGSARPGKARPHGPAGAMSWWTAARPACPSWAGRASERRRGAGADRRETPRADTGRLRADDLAAGSGPGHGDPRPVGHAGADHRRGRPGRRRPGTPADGGTRYRGRTRLLPPPDRADGEE